MKGAARSLRNEAASITERTSGTSQYPASKSATNIVFSSFLLYLFGRVQRRYALTSNITKRCIGERHGFLNFQSEKRTMDCHPNDLKGNKDEKKQQPSAKGKQGGAANQGEHR